MSDSDSDCELYTKRAERFQFKSRAEEIQDVIDMAENEKELREIMREVESGTAPNEAMLRVKIDPLIKRTSTQPSDCEIPALNISSSIDTTTFDDTEFLPNVEKNKTHSSKRKSVKTMVATRASTRKSTVASTKASLDKSKKSRELHRRNVGTRASTKLNINDEVVIVEDQEQLDSRRTRSRRNVPSRPQVHPPTNTIVFDDDSEYCNSITSNIDFNKPYNYNVNEGDQSYCSNLSISSIRSDTSFVASFEEPCFDDIPVKISIEWSNGKGMTLKNFELRKYQKFESVFEDLAKLEGIPVTRVLLLKQFTSICPSDSPATLDMNFYGALTGFVTKTDVVHSNTNLHKSDKSEANKKKPDDISVKVQLESKQTFVFNLGKYSKMETLYLMTCEELKCDKDKLKLVFDGEHVPPNAKLSTIDLEDGDVIHAHLKK